MSQLGQEIQVILQTEDGGRYHCEGFSGIPVVTPVFIGITTSGSLEARRAGAQLRRELTWAILGLSEQARLETVPCGGNVSSFFGCHAHNVTYCSKLLVWVGDRATPGRQQDDVDEWLHVSAAKPGYHALPVLPAGAPAHSVLPSALRHLNSVFWSASPAEVIPAIFAVLGLTAEEFRIFISYRRDDTLHLADQLFDALSHANFDVFLDRFRVEPAVDFQARLTEELANKSMVLILESKNILTSRWTQYEIDFAKLHRLGILAVQVPGGVMIPGIDSEIREVLGPNDFKAPTVDDVLTDGALLRVVERVKVEHGKALVRRRKYLREAMQDALVLAGVSGQCLGNDGLLHVKIGYPLKEYAILLTTRPPSLSDFHLADTRRLQTAAGLVIGPARSMMSANKARMDWLCQVSAIRCFDEAQIREVAQLMASGGVL